MLQFICKPFDELSLKELYALLRLRSEVFVVEQNCIFLDIDNKDQTCHHVLAYDNDTLVACTRLLAPNTAYMQMSIGRVASSLGYRGTGAGKAIMMQSIQCCYQLLGKGDIKIGAQLYLQKFYGSFGFEQTSEIYLEDGIEHIEMIKPYIGNIS
ncbi:GNAT family N-acetyltransferase [Parasediminibacterium sp. JCM 36343]|uniref:GNAT family N-acetyltransferase n=1 Tax=Parasediminibacterium sp. JCM 36343 TaxID=3374279 RepID=UPI00397AD423